MSGSHKEFPKKAVFIQLGLAALVGVGFLFADKPAVHAMAEKVTKPVVAAAQKVLAPVGKVEIKEEKMASAARTGEEVYSSGCGTCHDNGIAGAPKLDDKAAWETRLSDGFSALVASAINGKGGMPARGGNPDNSDSEMELAVSHMIKKAGIELVAKSAAAAPAKTAEPVAEMKTEEAPKVVEPVAETKTEEAPKAEETPAKVEEISTEKSKPVEEKTEITETAEEVKADVIEAVKEVKTEVAETVEEVKTETVEKTEEVATETKEAVEEKVEEIASKVEEVKTDVAAVASTSAAVASTAAVAAVDHSKGEAIYKASCFACHDSGVAGSPKVGDKDAWSARIAAGNDSMYEAAIKGKGAMPAKGGNMSIADDDIKAAVDYMAAKSM